MIGEVVAEKPQSLFVDLGYDVIKVPLDQVVSRGKPGAAKMAVSGEVVVDASDRKDTRSRMLT